LGKLGGQGKMNKLAKEIIESQDVEFICQHFFDFTPTRTQAKLIGDIAFTRHKRIDVSAMTRYGKTKCVSLGVAIYILINENKKIALIGPQVEQAQILRNYMTEAIFACPLLLNIAQIEVVGKERLQKEASRKRQTFTNGCEYRVFSAEGEANRLMGFGADLVVKDESCLINKEAHAKIMRMLGDNPEDSVLVELYNPWERDNVSFEHSNDPKWKHYKIGWEIALKEGRTTQAFVDEQREELTPLEFTVLYESSFPLEAEDSIFNLAKIKIAIGHDFGFLKELKELEHKIKNAQNYKEHEILKAKEEIKKFKWIISCDPADQGLDYTVMFWGIKKENKYQLLGEYNEPKSEPMEVVGRLIKILKDHYTGITNIAIHIDRIGIGSGALSRLKEVVKEKNLLNISIIGCHFGEKAVKEDHYANKKAENYFRAQALFNEEMLDIIDHKELTNQLLAMKWKLTSSSKRKVEDPDKSPDFADALIYFIWEDKQALAYAFAPVRR
jgi:hypothetical protein